MFFHLQYIHLFRPFLKYAPSTSPLPAHVSPRRICTAHAGEISKLMRLYKKTYSLRQICNIAVYMTHSACTIHLLNLPEKAAKRDIIHGVKHLEEIAEDWLCARRSLSILSVLAKKWNCELPGDIVFVLQRTDEKYGCYSTSVVSSPRSQPTRSPSLSNREHLSQLETERSLRNHIDLNPSLDSITYSSLPPQFHTDSLANSATSHECTQPLGQWNLQNHSAGVPNYASPFVPMARTHIGRETTNMNIDSPDWFLTDSARWQHSWGMDGNNHATSGQVFMFGDERNNNTEGNLRSESNNNVPGFEGLGTSLNGEGWLPGLD